jgi:hypothetical protein
MIGRIAVAIAVAIAAAGLAGCGEKPNVTLHKQGQYQGKPDNVPWQSAPFNNNKVEWEKAITARNERQNEYARMNDGGQGGAK